MEDPRAIMQLVVDAISDVWSWFDRFATNYTTVELIARVLLLNYFGNDRDTLYTDYISWKRLIEHGNFETIYNFLK